MNPQEEAAELEKRLYEQMMCLVGENPLPVYLGIAQFLAPGGEATLVCSEQTESMAAAIRKTGQRGCSYTIKRLANPFDPKPTSAALDEQFRANPGALLNFTGGTKVMAAYGLRAWSDAPHLAMYLDEPARMFRFANGVELPLIVSGLNIDVLCGLHGVDRGKVAGRPPVPYVDLAGLARIPGNPPWRDGTPWSTWREMLSDEGQRVLEEAGKTRRNRYFSEKNEWLEDFVRGTLLRLDRMTGRVEAYPGQGSLVREHEVVSGVHFFIGGSQFESDAMAVVNTALRYISVTTDSGERMAKAKSFEAMHRARQIGGDMARSCVVSLAPPEAIAQARKSIGEKRHTLFGRNDILRWVAGDGKALLYFMTD